MSYPDGKLCHYCGIRHTIAPLSSSQIGGKQHTVLPPTGDRYYHYKSYNAMTPSNGQKLDYLDSNEHAVVASSVGKPYECNNTTFAYPHDESCKKTSTVVAELKCYDEIRDKPIAQVCVDGFWVGGWVGGRVGGWVGVWVGGWMDGI